MFSGLQMCAFLGKVYHVFTILYQGVLDRCWLKSATGLQWKYLEPYIGPFLMLLQEARFFIENRDLLTVLEVIK